MRRECRCTPATLIEGVVYPTCTDSSRERRERPMPQGFSACAYRTINPVYVEDAQICLCHRDFWHRRPPGFSGGYDAQGNPSQSGR